MRAKTQQSPHFSSVAFLFKAFARAIAPRDLIELPCIEIFVGDVIGKIVTVQHFMYGFNFIY